MKTIIRIESIELQNFKNVKKGNIKINFNENESSVIGIYGQNGSGKTSVIESLKIFKNLLIGNSLEEYIINYISFNEKFFKLKFNLYFDNQIESKYKLEYMVIVSRNENTFYITNEVIKYSVYTNNEWSKTKSLIEYDYNSNDIILPVRVNQEIEEDKRANIIAAKELSKEKRTSFIFSNYFKKLLCEDSELFRIVNNILFRYAIMEMHVITNDNNGMINLNYLPLKYRENIDDKSYCGNIGLFLNKKSIVLKEQLDILKKIIDNMNKVLIKIIPNLILGIYEYEKFLNEEGNEVITIEILSIRGSIKIPLKYESEGIKKIISMLSLLIYVFNTSSAFVAIDEFDSGIYEYLLGQILEVIDERGKGQLIFTSHNLRALEILKSDNLYFTTLNPENRYIKIKNLKTNNNLRDVYFRAITLGGQNEKIYDETDIFEIERAFRMLGD